MKLESLRVGILGAGQLARMMAEISPKIGVACYVMADKKTDCAIPMAAGVTYNDRRPVTLRQFCQSVDVLTTENEFVDLDWLEGGLGSAPFYPGISCLRKIQNKLQQKKSLAAASIETLKFVEIHSKSDLNQVPERFGEEFVIKAARLGYDGKGTFIFDERNKFDLEDFWGKVSKGSSSGENFSGYAEPLMRFQKELAVIVARSTTGQILSYPVIETYQEKGICSWAQAPAFVNEEVAGKAQRLARRVIESFNGVGVFGVEMFLLDDGQVVINEVAPRVHNSGHLTMDGCSVGQFEMHLRAIGGRPLGGEALLWPAMAMANVIGAQSLKAERVAFKLTAQADVWPHWYGKSGETRGRKLGHINASGPSQDIALKKAMAARALVPV